MNSYNNASQTFESSINSSSNFADFNEEGKTGSEHSTPKFLNICGDILTDLNFLSLKDGEIHSESHNSISSLNEDNKIVETENTQSEFNLLIPQKMSRKILPIRQSQDLKAFSFEDIPEETYFTITNGDRIVRCQQSFEISSKNKNNKFNFSKKIIPILLTDEFPHSSMILKLISIRKYYINEGIRKALPKTIVHLIMKDFNNDYCLIFFDDLKFYDLERKNKIFINELYYIDSFEDAKETMLRDTKYIFEKIFRTRNIELYKDKFNENDDFLEKIKLKFFFKSQNLDSLNFLAHKTCNFKINYSNYLGRKEYENDKKSNSNVRKFHPSHSLYRNRIFASNKNILFDDYDDEAEANCPVDNITKVKDIASKLKNGEVLINIFFFVITIKDIPESVNDRFYKNEILLADHSCKNYIKLYSNYFFENFYSEGKILRINNVLITIKDKEICLYTLQNSSIFIFDYMNNEKDSYYALSLEKHFNKIRNKALEKFGLIDYKKSFSLSDFFPVVFSYNEIRELEYKLFNSYYEPLADNFFEINFFVKAKIQEIIDCINNTYEGCIDTDCRGSIKKHKEFNKCTVCSKIWDINVNKYYFCTQIKLDLINENRENQTLCILAYDDNSKKIFNCEANNYRLFINDPKKLSILHKRKVESYYQREFFFQIEINYKNTIILNDESLSFKLINFFEAN